MDPSKHSALIVGLSQYPKVGNLKGALNDLKAVKDWLTNELKVPIGNIESWCDAPPKYRDPSSGDFIRWLLELDDRAGEIKKVAADCKFPLGERLYVYYAGHGFEAVTARQTMIMPLTTTQTWDVVPMIPLRESLHLRAYFEEIVVIFDACRDVLSYGVDLNWGDKPSADLNCGNVKLFSSFASKTGKKAKEQDFGHGEWAGVLTQAFLAGAKGYAADEHGVVYSEALSKFLFAAVKDRLGLEWPPEVHDSTDTNIPWPLFYAAQRLPRIVIKPTKQTTGIAKFRKMGQESVDIDLSVGIQVKEVPYGYYAISLPDGSEIKITAAWEEKIVEV